MKWSFTETFFPSVNLASCWTYACCITCMYISNIWAVFIRSQIKMEGFFSSTNLWTADPHTEVMKLKCAFCNQYIYVHVHAHLLQSILAFKNYREIWPIHILLAPVTFQNYGSCFPVCGMFTYRCHNPHFFIVKILV